MIGSSRSNDPSCQRRLSRRVGLYAQMASPGSVFMGDGWYSLLRRISGRLRVAAQEELIPV